MNSPRPPIPDKAELFCHFCQRWKPRAAIVEATWFRNGAHHQLRYLCRACRDRLEKRRGG